MGKLKILFLSTILSVFGLCGVAFAEDPAILSSIQEKHVVAQVDEATLSEAKGADYQIRWKRFKFSDNYRTDSRSYNPANWTSAGFKLVISNYTGHVQADVVSGDILGNYTNNPNFGSSGSHWGSQWTSMW